MVKQIDARKPRFRTLGGLWITIQMTMNMFSIFVVSISVFGFYSLVYWQYFPSFWVFAILLGVIFLVLAIFSYIVVFPSQVGFHNRQAWEHDSPLRKELEEVHTVVKNILERLK